MFTVTYQIHSESKFLFSIYLEFHPDVSIVPLFEQHCYITFNTLRLHTRRFKKVMRVFMYKIIYSIIHLNQQRPFQINIHMIASDA
jgi:hypothetical protein